MAEMEDLPQAIVDRITVAQAAGGSLFNDAAAVVLMEDVHDLQTEINKAIGQIGMLILIGMPHWKNTATMQNPNVQDVIQIAIAIGEHPVLWRSGERDKAPTVASIIEQLLHNYKIPGFQYLKVTRVDYIPDKKRQLYEVSVETQLITPVLAN
jgi:hypothetical protein